MIVLAAIPAGNSDRSEQQATVASAGGLSESDKPDVSDRDGENIQTLFIQELGHRKIKNSFSSLQQLCCSLEYKSHQDSDILLRLGLSDRRQRLSR